MDGRHVGSYLLNSDSRWARAVKNEAERLEAGEVSRGQVLGEAEGSHWPGGACWDLWDVERAGECVWLEQNRFACCCSSPATRWPSSPSELRRGAGQGFLQAGTFIISTGPVGAFPVASSTGLQAPCPEGPRLCPVTHQPAVCLVGNAQHIENPLKSVVSTSAQRFFSL